MTHEEWEAFLWGAVLVSVLCAIGIILGLLPTC